MTRENQLKFCRKCTKQKFDLHKGIVCSLTDNIATFEEECELYNENPELVEDKKALITEEKTQHVSKHIPEQLLLKFRSEQNLIYGLIGGLQAAIIGALLWAFITIATEYQIGYMAIAVGLIVGVAVRYFGNGIDKIYGIIGGILAFLGCFTGNYLSTVGFIATEQSLSYFETLILIDFSTFLNIMIESFNPMDILFYGLAIYEGFRFSFRKIKNDDLDENKIISENPSKLKPRLIFAFLLIIGFSIVTFIKSENGIRTYYYESGEKISEGIMNYGKFEGKWTYWYENGQIQSIGNYIKDKEDSTWIFYSQNNTIIQQGDFKNGLMHGKWIYNFDDGSLSHEGLYENDRQNGKWIYYFQNGKKYQECSFVRDLLDGEWTTWHENSEISEKGFFTENFKNGDWKIYQLNGDIQEELTYNNDTVTIHNLWDKNGKQLVKNGEGKLSYYFDNKNISSEGEIKNGKPQGLWITYYENGQKQEEKNFENNIPKTIKKWTFEGEQTITNGNGKYQSYYDDGTLFTEGEIQDGIKEGVWNIYYQNGEILTTNMYKSNKLYGLQESWYDNGNLNVSGKMKDDKREGEWFWYFENGNILSTAFFINGEKEGTQKFWNNFNKLIKEEIYKNGELVKVKII